MVKTHPRSPSPELRANGMKRPKIVHVEPFPPDAAPNPTPRAPPTPQELTACFAPDLFDVIHVGRLTASYSTSEPFKHALIQKLFQDDLLQQVKDECLSELHFTEKETDIYKVCVLSPPSHLIICSLPRSTRRVI
jgi:hypothetical protein